MNKELFTATLKKKTNNLEIRYSLVNSCLKNTPYIAILLKNMQQVGDKNSTFSARILELSCHKNLDLIIPYLDTFCDLLSKVKLDGSVRPCAKVCELLMLEYFSIKKKNLYYKNKITKTHLEKINTAGFDWMINNMPTAIQAYTMQTLYLIGTKYDWIHPELAQVIEKNIPTGSVGLVNRGRKVIKAIQTQTKLKL